MKWLGMVATACVAMGCVGPAPSGTGGGAGKPFVFGWRSGELAIEETIERDADVLTLSWRAKVEAAGDRLRVSFSEATLSEGVPEALGPAGEHAFYQVMPDLVVEAKTGRLVAVENVADAVARSGRLGIKTKADERSLGAVKTLEAVEARARERWGQWARLVGFKHKVGTSEERQKLKLEDGQEMPVVTKTSHARDGEMAVVSLVRSFSGAAVTKIYKSVLASTGAAAEVVEAVEKVLRDERYEATVDPKTLRATRIVSREVTTEHSRGDKVLLKAASETWTFVW